MVGAGPVGLSAAIFTKLDGWTMLFLEVNWVGGQGYIAYTVTDCKGFPMGHGAVLLENMEKRVNSSPPVGIGAELRRENVSGINTKGLVVTTEANQYQARTIVLVAGKHHAEAQRTLGG